MTARRGPLTGLLLAVTLVGLPGVAATAQTQSPDPGSTAQATLTATIDESIAALAAEVGGDPEAARTWVADAITGEDYPGVLKGARGAYLTSAANSADQALLLAELLGGDDATTPIRFASCAVETPVAPDPTVSPESPLDHADEIVADVEDPELAAAVLALRDYRMRTRERTAVAAAGLEAALATVAGPAAAALTTGPTEHVWLQVEQGGTWVDQDPSTASGVAPCVAASTFDALPESLDDRVRLALTVERQVAGALETSTALETELPIADLAASRIAFGFAEPIGLIQRPPDDPTAARTYTPVLQIDNTSVMGTPFTLPPIASSDEEGVGGFDGFGGFDGSLGGDEAVATEVEPVSAAWLDIQLTAPDGTVTALRSEVFDRIGVVARAGGTAASAVVEPLPVANDDYAALGTLWQVGLLLGEMRAPDAVIAPFLDVLTVDGLSGTLDALLRMFPAMRRDLGGGTTLPTVLLAGFGSVTGPEKRGGLEPGEVATQLTFDALHVPAETSMDRAGEARDAQAILAAEGMLAALTGGSVDPLGDTGAVMSAARAAAVPLVTLEPGDVPQVPGASPLALARMSARLGQGYTILTPATAPALYGTAKTAWWLVDPATGAVRDEHESGRHQANVEYGGNTSRQSSKWQQLCAFTHRIRLPIAVAAFALAAATGFDPKSGGALLKAVAKTGSAAYQRKKKADEALKLACPGEAPPGPPLP